jgi:hypothetical protein
MTNREIGDAAAALALWFKSQQIGQASACSVMVCLLGGIIAQNADDDLECVGALASFTNDLAVQIKLRRQIMKGVQS